MVHKKSSTTTKIRTVFDATSFSITLNDTLMVGTTVHPPLVDDSGLPNDTCHVWSLSIVYRKRVWNIIRLISNQNFPMQPKKLRNHSMWIIIWEELTLQIRQSVYKMRCILCFRWVVFYSVNGIVAILRSYKALLLNWEIPVLSSHCPILSSTPRHLELNETHMMTISEYCWSPTYTAQQRSTVSDVAKTFDTLTWFFGCIREGLFQGRIPQIGRF